MNEQTPAEIFSEASTWLVGIGILTMALFPLAIPMIALTVIAALPLLVIGLAVGLIGALIAAPIVLGLRLARRERGAESGRAAERHPTGAPGRLA